MRQELLGIPGVVTAKVSYDDRLATVRYDESRVTVARLVEVVDATGFGAAPLDKGPDQ